MRAPFADRTLHFAREQPCRLRAKIPFIAQRAAQTARRYVWYTLIDNHNSIIKPANCLRRAPQTLLTSHTGRAGAAPPAREIWRARTRTLLRQPAPEARDRGAPHARDCAGTAGSAASTPRGPERARQHADSTCDAETGERVGRGKVGGGFGGLAGAPASPGARGPGAWHSCSRPAPPCSRHSLPCLSAPRPPQRRVCPLAYAPGACARVLAVRFCLQSGLHHSSTTPLPRQLSLCCV